MSPDNDRRRSFINHSPERFTLIGFSMGGYVALELYGLIPQKVEKLILINSAAKVVSKEWWAEQERALALLTKGKFDLLIQFIFQNSFFGKEKFKTLFPFIRDMALGVGANNYRQQLRAIRNKNDHSSLLKDITCSFASFKMFILYQRM